MQRSNAVVAFFCGTGYDFHHGNQDPSLITLADSITSKKDTTVMGFDGCHANGGGLFAFGLDVSANALYEKIILEHAAGEDKINVVITAHSRGCLSALLFAKKVQADALLRNRVEITLDFRDPVPGNFRPSSELDVAGISTIAGQLFDMTDCKCIKAAHITIQEEGFAPLGFDVLIPTFAPTTTLEVEGLPGTHAIQQSPGGYLNQEYHPRLHSPLADNHLYCLGMCKSLQLYVENDVAVDLEYFARNIQSFNLDECDAAVSELIDAAKHFDKAETLKLLTKIQLAIYAASLAYHAHRRDELEHPLQKRGIHFGGKFENIAHREQATHLNNRHARLINEAKNNALKDAEVKPLFHFNGKRHDVDKREAISRHYDELAKQCTQYADRLNSKLNFTKEQPGSLEYLRIEGQAKFVTKLKNILADKPYSSEQMLAKMQTFKVEFDKTKAFFTGPYGAKFKSNALNIFLSIATLGIYAGIRAIDSKVCRGYFAFWKQRKEVFMENAQEQVAAMKIG